MVDVRDRDIYHEAVFMRGFGVSLLLLLCSLSSYAGQLDTIKYFDERAGYVYYQDATITMQAARFELRAPGELHRVVVTLGGRSVDGSVRLRVFGLEGGLPAPGLERDLITPILVRKSRAGVERIVVDIPNPVRINGHQFFIGIDNISPDVTLLSDKKTKRPSCVSENEAYYYQMLRGSGGGWTWGRYAFVVEAMVEYDISHREPYLINATKELALPDSLARNHSIAWGDVDHDGYLDLLFDGSLYRNNRGESFSNVSIPLGNPAKPRANLFIDINNDAALDLLFLGSLDSANTASSLFLNDGSGHFTKRSLNIPAIIDPTSFSIADSDSDGYLDLFVGQGAAANTSYILVNNRQLGFIDRTEMLYPPGAAIPSCHGSQWVDVDGDGDLDLYIATSNDSEDELWIRNDDASYVNVLTQKGVARRDQLVGARVGCHWADYDNDGDMDLLLPQRVSLQQMKATSEQASSVVTTIDAQLYDYSSYKADIHYEERPSGGAWGDVNNDGRLDLILTTSCGCRYASLYLQREEGGFIQETHEAGLIRIAAGEDAVWVDYNNDGKLDLATLVDGRLAIFKNTSISTNNSISLDLEGGHAVGARAEVFAGDMRYTQEVTSGRGVLMQGPLRLHYGLADARSADSVIVRWGNGRSDRYYGLDANTIHKLREGGGISAIDRGMASIDASPNPFSTRLQLHYTIPMTEHVSVGIYTLDGTRVRLLVDEKQSAGSHDVIWDTKDDRGERVSQGTYLYRLSTSAGEQTGKVLMVR